MAEKGKHSSDFFGLIHFRTSLLETLAVHDILKSFLQHDNLKASIPFDQFFSQSSFHIRILI